MKNPFHLPTPVELGRSDSEALEMREFSPETENYTWEDYYKETKTKFPIKYFFSITLPRFLSRHLYGNYSPVVRLYYYLYFHIFQKHHFIDLRQPKDSVDFSPPYRYGWLDSDHKILYANFAILTEFVERELAQIPNKYTWTEEDLEDPATSAQHKAEQEVKALYNYWKIERPKDYNLYHALLSLWQENRKNDKNKEIWALLNKKEEEINQKETDMLIRLINIRKTMWT